MINEWRQNSYKQARAHGVEIWPQNWHASQVFLSMETQWRVVCGTGGLVFTGLDYNALRYALAEHRDIQHRQPISVLMPQLRTLELVARQELNRE